MKRILVKFYKFLRFIFSSLKTITFRFFEIFRSDGLFPTTVYFGKLIRSHLVQFLDELNGSGVGFMSIDDKIFEKHRVSCESLHQALRLKFSDDPILFSILIPVYNPKPSFLRKAIQSALNQTAQNFEILLGLDGPQEGEVRQVISEFGDSIRVFEFDRDIEGGGISRTTNQLAKQALGTHFLLMDHDDWIRPDLLYRYEQSYRKYKNKNIVLSCDENKIDQNGRFIPETEIQKPILFSLPYLGVNLVCHCLCIPSEHWRKIDGLRPECDGAQDFDLVLRLDQIGVLIRNVPVTLYAWRIHSGSTAQDLLSKPYVNAAGEKALRDTFQARGLKVEVGPGHFPSSYRISPKQLRDDPSILVCLLFQEQSEGMEECIESILNQKNVNTYITLVSTTQYIGKISSKYTNKYDSNRLELMDMHTPFHYSHWLNHGMNHSKFLNQTAHLALVRNSVLFEANSFREMAEWLELPNIGMVGARVFNSFGELTQGGIQVNSKFSKAKMPFLKVDAKKRIEDCLHSRYISVPFGIEANACLLKKETWNQVGGFDEDQFPLMNFDIEFILRLRKRGYLPLYTPFANAVQKQEATPPTDNYIDDYEWLQNRHTILDLE